MSLLSSLFSSSKKQERTSPETPMPAVEELSPEALVKLRDERIEIGKTLKETWQQDSYAPCPPVADNPFPQIVGRIPEVKATDLDVTLLAGAIRHHGALIVRGLMTSDEAAELRADIDRVMQTDPKKLKRNRDHSDINTSEDEALFCFRKDLPINYGDVKFAVDCGSIFTFISPRISDKLLRYFDRLSLRSVLKSYFNEEPCVSFKKSVLRRVEPKGGVAEWHQDGAFMTEDIASLNVWMALSDCGPGTGAPGMKFVPKRHEHIIEETGKNGAMMGWSVSQKTVDEKYTGDEAEVSPKFGEGDAIFFDHLNLHATAVDPEFTKTRYAVETWFFAASRPADNQISVAWV